MRNFWGNFWEKGNKYGCFWGRLFFWVSLNKQGCFHRKFGAISYHLLALVNRSLGKMRYFFLFHNLDTL